MIYIALKFLLNDRSRYTTLTFAVAVISFLLLQQSSIFCGLILRTAVPVDVISAPIWVCRPTITSIDDSQPLSDQDLEEVRSVPGVVSANAVVLRTLLVTLPNNSTQMVRAYGLADEDISELGLRRRPSESIRGGAAAFVGTAVADRLGNPKAGSHMSMNRRDVQINGSVPVPRDFFSYPFLFLSYPQLKELLGLHTFGSDFILVHGSPQVPAGILARRIIQARPNLAVYTKAQFRWLTMRYYLTHTGIALSICVSLAMVVLGGALIVGQTFYVLCLNNRHAFAAFSVMGASRSTLRLMVTAQAAVIGVVGFGFGLGLMALFGICFGGQQSSVALGMPAPLPPICLLFVLLVCASSAWVGIRKVLAVDPAVVFQS